MGPYRKRSPHACSEERPRKDKAAIYKPGRGPSPGNKLYRTLGLGLLSLRNCGEIRFCCLSHTVYVYGIVLRQPEQTDTSTTTIITVTIIVFNIVIVIIVSIITIVVTGRTPQEADSDMEMSSQGVYSGVFLDQHLWKGS